MNRPPLAACIAAACFGLLLVISARVHDIQDEVRRLEHPPTLVCHPSPDLPSGDRVCISEEKP